MFNGFLNSMATFPQLRKGKSRSINWENRTGEKGKGYMMEKTYCTPFLGYPFYSRDDNFHNDYYNRDVPPMRSFYRWHIMDPVLFEKDLRVEIQQIGVGPLGLFERQDDVTSVSYWYQTEPHAKFPQLPEARGLHEC